jgi:hypothetical protein
VNGLPAVRVAVGSQVGVVNTEDIVYFVIKSLLNSLPLADLFWECREWFVQAYILTMVNIIEEYCGEDHYGGSDECMF